MYERHAYPASNIMILICKSNMVCKGLYNLYSLTRDICKPEMKLSLK